MFCVCILPLLVPCNRHTGNDGGVAEPSALWPLCCTITAWLETHNHADTPLRLCILSRSRGSAREGSAVGTRPAGRKGVGWGVGRGLQRALGGTSGLSPLPSTARPRAGGSPGCVPSSGDCLPSPPLVPRPNLGTSFRVFLWGVPTSFPNFSSGGNCPSSPIPGTPAFDLCAPPYGPHIQVTILFPHAEPDWVGTTAPCFVAVAPGGSPTTPCPPPPPLAPPSSKPLAPGNPACLQHPRNPNPRGSPIPPHHQPLPSPGAAGRSGEEEDGCIAVL